jgi:predicted lipoprotein with Yx(FWY)xxD motif
MKRLMTLGSTISAAVALAACGSGGTSAGAPIPAGPQGGKDTVAARQLPGVGSVLVDQAGQTLYTSNLEASGKIVCVAPCTAFWKPLTPSGSKPTASAEVAGLGTIKRPTGGTQVTIKGKPLYTFVEDSPGTVKGNNFHDQFGGRHFTWHAVLSSGAVALPAAQPTAKTPVQSTSRSYGSPY